MNKRSTSEWQALFKQHATSGLSVAAFCREHGLCAKYFSLRRKQLCSKSLERTFSKTTLAGTSSAFVPAHIRPDVMAVIVIRCGEIEISLPGSVDAICLSAFVAGLRT